MATVSKHHGEQEGEGDDGVGSWRWDPQQPEVRTSSAPFPSRGFHTQGRFLVFPDCPSPTSPPILGCPHLPMCRDSSSSIYMCTESNRG
jgi:hypothetical protein